MYSWFDKFSCSVFSNELYNEFSMLMVKTIFVVLIALLIWTVLSYLCNDTKLAKAIKYHWNHWERRRRFVRNIKAVCRGASRDIYRKVVR